MRNKIVALAGRAQSGKSETSKILTKLAEKDGIKVQTVSFAGPLKEIAAKYFGWDGDKELYTRDGNGDIRPCDPDYDEDPISDKGRQLLINIGMKFREIRDTIWADLALETIRKVDKEDPENHIFLIDDMRFKNEIEAVSSFERYVMVRLERPEQLNINNVSENSLNGIHFDIKIENDGTVEDLGKKVEDLYNQVIKND